MTPDRLLLPLFLASTFACTSSQDYVTKDILDSMELMMSGRSEFNPEYLTLLEQCMEQTHQLLKDSHNMAWSGFVQYSDSNGMPGDVWGEKRTNFHEYNQTQQSYRNISIYEPCNYASNVAYYRVATQICSRSLNPEDPWNLPPAIVEPLTEVFVQLSMMSAFMHGSNTELGGHFDVQSNALLAYDIHQAMLSNLECANATIAWNLQLSPRNRTAIELVDDLRELYLEIPVYEWSLDTFDMPDLFTGFGGIIVTVVTILFEDDTADSLFAFLKDLFVLDDAIYDFLMLDVVPEVRNCTSDLHVSVVDKLHLEGNALSTIIKLLYAFLWQEEWSFFEGHLDMILDPAINALGTDYLPVVNGFANSLNNFIIYDLDLQNGTGIYPGDFWCNLENPHSKWHLQSAAGLTDLVFLADDVFRITIND